MQKTPDYSQMTKTELNQLLLRSTAATSEYNNILSALKNKEKIDELQSSKNFTWSKIAGIAAIVAAILAFYQALFPNRSLIDILLFDKKEKQVQVQDTPQPTKNTISSFS